MPQIVTRCTCSFLKIDEIRGMKWADHRGGGTRKMYKSIFPGNQKTGAGSPLLRGCVKTTYPHDSQSPQQPPTCVSSPPAKFIVSRLRRRAHMFWHSLHILYN